MSLMFSKQFSEAGVTGSGQGRKGGRGKAGSGLMAKPKGRNRRDGDDAGGGGDSSSGGGLFNTDSSYRTHMLFPGRKDDDAMGPEPRRSSGSSPGFMKTMMSWGSKRPSGSGTPGGSGQDGGMAAGGRHHRATPTRTESELLFVHDGGGGGAVVDREPLLLSSPSSSSFHSPPFSSPSSSSFCVDPLLFRKTVSFHEGLPASYTSWSGDDDPLCCDPLLVVPTNRQNGHLVPSYHHHMAGGGSNHWTANAEYQPANMVPGGRNVILVVPSFYIRSHISVPLHIQHPKQSAKRHFQAFCIVVVV